MSSLVVITPAGSPALDFAAVKEHLRVDHDDEDTLIEGLILAVEQHVVEKLQRSLINQELELRVDGLCSGIELPNPPFVEISSIEYLDDAGNERTLDAGVYQVVEDDSGLARLILAYGKSWPSHSHAPESVRICYFAGYGEAPEDIPAPIRQAMLLLVGHYFEHRESVVSGATPIVMPLGVEALLAHFKIWR